MLVYIVQAYYMHLFRGALVGTGSGISAVVVMLMRVINYSHFYPTTS